LKKPELSPESNGEPTKDFKQESDMIRCLSLKDHPDSSVGERVGWIVSRLMYQSRQEIMRSEPRQWQW
jgi:hypothetical protein